MKDDLSVRMIRELAIAMALDIAEDMCGVSFDDAMPVDVIRNGPATVVFFDDESKVVSKCSEEDVQNDRVGVLACCVRKAMHNRRFDHLDYLIRTAAVMLRTPDAADEFAYALNMYSNALRLEED